MSLKKSSILNMYTPRLPPLGRSYSTRQRDLSSPRALNAAMYQTTISRRDSTERYGNQPQKTSQKFVEEIETYIHESVSNTKNKNDEFKVYQEAFQYLIETFGTQSRAMSLVKEGYDQVINDLMKKDAKGNQHRLVVQKSMTSLNNALSVKQEAFEKKKKKFNDLMTLLHSTIADLKEEIAQLHDTIRTESKKYKKQHAAANRTQTELYKLQVKIDESKKLKMQYTEENKDNRAKRVELEELAVTTQAQLTNVLNSISNSNLLIARSQTSIIDIGKQIEEVEQKIKQRNDTIGQKKEEKEILRNEIKSVNEQAQKIRVEMDDLSRVLKLSLSSAGISNHVLAMIGDDPIKLVACAISFKNGYKEGIHPDLFPDLC